MRAQHDTSMESQDDSLPFRVNRRRFLASIRQFFWLVLVLAVLGAGLGWFRLQRTPFQYEATAVLEATRDSLNVLKMEGLENPTLTDNTAMNTLVQAIKSRNVLQRVVKELALADRSDFAGTSSA